ncbi:MAG: YicC family protein [Lachnospiraceae bacterium]|nr:YicC family protein [Lachnospiraceae bacterium]
MVYSMTGFGRGEATTEGYRITAEIRSVNNRYLDLNLKLPRRLLCAETEVRSLLKRYMKRGKVDLFVSYVSDEGIGAQVRYNHEIAREYLESLKRMAMDFGLEDDVHLTSLARFPDVFTTEEEELDENEMTAGILQAVEAACRQFVEVRKKEGGFLRDDLIEKLTVMASDVDAIRERSPQIIEEYKQSLRAKVADLLEDNKIDEGRLSAEITLYADKICVDEELVRLTSHIGQMKDALEKGDERDGIGRKLDFIAQEMNREANTILSKSTDLEISDRGIGLKTTIEKVREQIQNVE